MVKYSQRWKNFFFSTGLYSGIEKFGLNVFLWETIEKKYTYRSPVPTIKDFLLHLINDNFERSIPGGKPALNKEAYLFVNRWKENTKARSIFSEWSNLLEAELGVEGKLQQIPAEGVLEADTYPSIDKKIILSLREHISQNTLSDYTIQEWIEKRKVKFFYSQFEQLYNALSYASALLDEIRKSNLAVNTLREGFDKYQKQWYKTDRLYRKYIHASEHSEHQSILKDLTKQVEKAYGNSFLLKLGDNWQALVDGMKSWEIDRIPAQRQFYQNRIQPYLNKDNRVFVIISDALRYESATELQEIILQEDRYTATLTAVLGSLPSYTQLGMASLLPHKELTFQEKKDIVYADGQ